MHISKNVEVFQAASVFVDQKSTQNDNKTGRI